MSHAILLEIGTEEIPHEILFSTINLFEKAAKESLEKSGVVYSNIKVTGTARRLVLIIENMESKTRERVIDRKGPMWSKAYDAEGKPTKALQGFLRGNGVDAIEKKNFNGHDYAFFQKKEGGEDSRVLLKTLFPEIITALHFPKAMKWGRGTFAFVRPIRWIVALANDSVLDFSFQGLKSGRISQGHRMLSPGQINVSSATDYFSIMEKHKIIVDYHKRTELIAEQVEKSASQLHAKAILSQKLLETLTSLTEYPVVTVGEFDKDFLELPKEVLISEMIDHQMFVPLEDRQGRLLNKFLITANIPSNKNVVKGNERVIRARFSDGKFFFDEDRKRSLESRVDDLERVSFAKGLGTLKDKVLRMQKLAIAIIGQLGMDALKENALKAVLLCKADLVTGMVGEFDELQGVMGSYYAVNDGEHKNVAQAIREHYLPKFSGDALPETEEGVVASLADRVDNLFSLYATGKFVTGSKDPFALRRQTLGVIRILIEKRLHLDFAALFDEILPYYHDFLTIEEQDFKKAILSFITTRIKTVFKEYGFAYDEIEAGITGDISDIYDSYLRISAIHEVRETQDFINLSTAFKRVKNIIGGQKTSDINTSLFSEAAERELHTVFEKHGAEFEKALAKRDYRQAVGILTSFRVPVDKFFDDVLVMDKDDAIRTNRISLLSGIDKLFAEFIDFAKIVVE